MGEMLEKGALERVARVTQAVFAMKWLDLAALRRAFEGGRPARRRGAAEPRPA